MVEEAAPGSSGIGKIYGVCLQIDGRNGRGNVEKVPVNSDMRYERETEIEETWHLLECFKGSGSKQCRFLKENRNW